MEKDLMKIGNVLHAESGSTCASCGHPLGGPGDNWKQHALARRGSAAERLNGGEFGPFYRVHENQYVELAELFCPECHALLSVELYLKGEPYRRDYRSLEAARESGYDAVAEFKENPELWISF
jgi:acetone carboxylase gamma subunit